MIEDITYKVCSKCGEEKPMTTEYYTFRKESGKFRNECKDCMKNYHKKYYVENKELLDKKNIEYYNNNREYLLDKMKDYREDNYDKIYAQKEKWRHNNQDKINKRQTELFKIRYNNDLIFRLQVLVRNNIKKGLKRNNLKKNSPTLSILGCSIEDFKKKIESQFQEGMSWDNYGIYGWHLDHIIPLSLAKTEEDVYRLNHYTNLQPLWAKDNLRKYNKLPEEIV